MELDYNETNWQFRGIFSGIPVIFKGCLLIWGGENQAHQEPIFVTVHFNTGIVFLGYVNNLIHNVHEKKQQQNKTKQRKTMHFDCMRLFT